MRIFIIVLVLIFNFQSWSKADDIRDFQLEGIAIGDSVLDHFGETEFLKFKRLTDFKDNTYTSRETHSKKVLKTFDTFQITFFTNDRDYIVQGISGLIDYSNNYKECIKEKKKVIKELENLFPNSKLHGPKKRNMMSAKGYWEGSAYILPQGDLTIVACYNYDDKNRRDHFRISVRKKAFDLWLVNKAYK